MYHDVCTPINVTVLKGRACTGDWDNSLITYAILHYVLQISLPK